MRKRTFLKHASIGMTYSLFAPPWNYAAAEKGIGSNLAGNYRYKSTALMEPGNIGEAPGNGQVRM